MILLRTLCIQLKKKSEKLQEDNKKKEETYTIKKKILDLLPNAPDNITMLEVIFSS